MGMFESLDEFIWKQYAKGTNFMWEHFGETKYDLSRKCDTMATASFLGTAASAAYVNTWVGGSPIVGTFAVGFTLLAGGYYFVNKRINNFTEERDMDTDTPFAPTAEPFRPLLLGASIGLIHTGIEFPGYVLQGATAESPEAMRQAADLLTKIGYGITSFGTGLASHASAEYFRDQLPPTGNKERKGLFQGLKDYIQSVGAEPVPVPIKS